MQHVVFGAGLIGGYLAGAMTDKGLDVSMVARPAVQEKLADGLRLTDYQDHAAEINQVTFISDKQLGDAPQSRACDFLWLTVKCTAVESALDELPALVGPNTVIFCVQNGLGSDKAVKEKFPHNTVMRAMVVFNVAEPSAGHLHRGSEGYLWIEELADCPDIARDLATNINSPLLPTRSCDHMQALLWAKLQLNLANAVNALADIPVKEMLEDRDYRRVIAMLMRELLVVCKAKNIELPAVANLPGRLIPIFIALPDFVFKRVGQKMIAIDPTVRASMWWDLSAGKTTEVDYLNGAVVREGEALGLQSSANKRLVEMIHAAERGQLARGISGKDLIASFVGHSSPLSYP
ncbi:2-dehydropantoate 2-reductase [Congregibacter variabilis]|uniref:2-dehydropantoate 2-reductase n=1 Tax=Congregibacter variabilis TaxID=3081200 RepID=A0ABZ0I148_9GAMM|nr:2-dehydropantoate 2-reductase [Congregibacter sp. IMCC43200]